MTREWNASAYDALPLPHVGWGQRLLDRLATHDLDPHARVLDAGCGTGRDAAAALERWPGLRLVLLDGSAQMLAKARERLGDAVDYVHADLMQPLPVDGGIGGPVDAVMSVAAFHWVPDHDVLFAHLAAVMRPGASLVTECGGHGNIATVNAAIAEVLGTDPKPVHFADEADTTARLEAAGFEVRSVRLRPEPFRCEDPDVLEAYLATVILGAELERVPAEHHEEFVRGVRLAMPGPEVDYVRLEIDAIRVTAA